jgi:hypothetical protein
VETKEAKQQRLDTLNRVFRPIERATEVEGVKRFVTHDNAKYLRMGSGMILRVNKPGNKKERRKARKGNS